MKITYLILLLFLIKCQTTQGQGLERANNAINKMAEVYDLINKLNIPDDYKKNIKNKLDEASAETLQLGIDVDVNKKIADENESAAKKWLWTKIIGGILLTLGAGYIIKRSI